MHRISKTSLGSIPRHMEVSWNPSQQLYVVKRTPTYIIYASKKQIFRQLVDNQYNPVTWPSLLFENNVYIGPSSHEIFTKGVAYLDTEIEHISNLDSQHFQHTAFRLVTWHQYI